MKKPLTDGFFTLRQAGRALRDFALCTARKLPPKLLPMGLQVAGVESTDNHNYLICKGYPQMAKMPPIAPMARSGALAQRSRVAIAQVYPQPMWIKKNTQDRQYVGGISCE